MREIYAVTTAAFLSSTTVQVYPETNWICEETAHHVLRQDSKYLFQVLLYDSHCLIMQLFSHAVINIYRETKDVLFLVAQFEAMLLPSTSCCNETMGRLTFLLQFLCDSGASRFWESEAETGLLSTQHDIVSQSTKIS